MSSPALAAIPPILSCEGLQFGRARGFQVSEMENLMLERQLIALKLLASLALGHTCPGIHTAQKLCGS